MSLESCFDKKQMKNSHSLACFRRTVKELRDTLHQFTQESASIDDPGNAVVCSNLLQILTDHSLQIFFKNNLSVILLLEEKITTCLRCIPVGRPSWAQVIPNYLCLCKAVSQLCLKKEFKNTCHKDMKTLATDCSVLADMIVQLVQSNNNIRLLDAYVTLTNFYKADFFQNVPISLLIQTLDFLQDQCYRKYEKQDEEEISFLLDFVLLIICDESVNVHVDDKMIIATKLLKLYVNHPRMLVQYPKWLVESLKHFFMLSQQSVNRNLSQTDCLLLIDLHNLTALKPVQNLSLQILASLTNPQVLLTSLNTFRNKKNNSKQFPYEKDLDWILIFSYIPLSFSSLMNEDVLVHILKLVYDCTLILPNEEALRIINKCLVILIHFYGTVPDMTIKIGGTGITQMLLCLTKLLVNHHKTVSLVKTTSTVTSNLGKTLKEILPNVLKLASLTVQVQPQNLSVLLGKDAFGRSFYHICCLFITSLQSTKKASEEFLTFCHSCFQPATRCQFSTDLIHSLLDCLIQLAEFFLTVNEPHTLLTDVFIVAGNICQELQPEHQSTLCNVALCCLDNNDYHSLLLIQVTKFLYRLLECHGDVALNQSNISPNDFYEKLSTYSVKVTMYQSRSNPIRTNVQKILAAIPHRELFLNQWITWIDKMKPLTDNWNVAITGCTLCLSNEKLKLMVMQRLCVKRLLKDVVYISRDNQAQNALKQGTSQNKSAFFVLLDSIRSLLTCSALSSRENGELVLFLLPTICRNSVRFDTSSNHILLEQLKKVAVEVVTSTCNISINENFVQKALSSVHQFIMALLLSEGHNIHGVVRACWLVYLEKFLLKSQISNYLEECLLMIFKKLFAKTTEGYKCSTNLLTSTLQCLQHVNLKFLKNKNCVLMKMENLKVDSQHFKAIDISNELNSFTFVILLGIQQIHVRFDASSWTSKLMFPYVAEVLLNQFLTLQKEKQVSSSLLPIAISIVNLLQHEEIELLTKKSIPNTQESLITTLHTFVSEPFLFDSDNVFSNGYTLLFLMHLSMFLKNISSKGTYKLLQHLLYQVYNLTRAIKSIHHTKTYLEESLIQGLCFLASHLTTKHPTSTLLFKQVLIILREYDLKRLSEIPVYYSFLQRQLETIQNGPTITVENHLLMFYLQAILAERPEYHMEEKNIFNLLFEIFKIYFKKLNSYLTPSDNLLRNLSVTVRQLTEICHPTALRNKCNGRRTHLVVNHWEPQDASIQFNNNDALAFTKVYVPVTQIAQTRSTPIQDNILAYHRNICALRTDVACQTPVSDSHAFTSSKHIHESTMVLQRFNALPDAELRMRLVKKLIAPLTVSQGTLNYFNTIPPPSVQHILLFWDGTSTDPEKVFRNSAPLSVVLPMYSRIIINATVEPYVWQENSSSWSAVSWRCINSFKIKLSFPMHATHILQNLKKNENMDFLLSPDTCYFSQLTDPPHNILPRVCIQDNSISSEDFLGKSSNTSFTSMLPPEAQISEYEQQLCPLIPQTFLKRIALLKLDQNVPAKYTLKNFTINFHSVSQNNHSISHQNALNQTYRGVRPNALQYASRALPNEVTRPNHSLITYAPKQLHLFFFNTSCRNHFEQPQKNLSAFVTLGISEKSVDSRLSSASSKFKLPFPILTQYHNLDKDRDSCQLSTSMDRMKSVKTARPPYHGLIPGMDQALMHDCNLKAGPLYFKLNLVKKKMNVEGVVMLPLKRNFTEILFLKDSSSQRLKRHSTTIKDQLQHLSISHLNSNTSQNDPYSVSKQNVDEVYNFSMVSCNLSISESHAVREIHTSGTPTSCLQFPTWNKIRVTTRLKPLKSNRNNLARSIMKTTPFFEHSYFVKKRSCVNKVLPFVSCAGDNAFNPGVHPLTHQYNLIKLMTSHNKRFLMASFEKGHMCHDLTGLKKGCYDKGRLLSKKKVGYLYPKKHQSYHALIAISLKKRQGVLNQKKLPVINFENHKAQKVTSPLHYSDTNIIFLPKTLYEEENSIFKTKSANQFCCKSDVGSKSTVCVRQDHLELKNRIADLSYHALKKNDVSNIKKVIPSSLCKVDNALTKLDKCITCTDNASKEAVTPSVSLRGVTLRQISELWERTRRNETLQHDVVNIFFETTFALIKIVFLDYKDLKASDTYLHEERVCGCRCLCLLHHDPLWIVKCSLKKEVLLLLEIWDHCLKNDPFCLIHVVHTFLDGLMFNVEWKEWLLPSFLFNLEKKTSWSIQETFLKSFIFTLHSFNSIPEPFHLLLLHIYVGLKLSDFSNDSKYSEKAKNVLDEMALIDILLCLVTMWKNKHISKPEILIHVVKALRGFLSPRCLRLLNQTILLRRLMPLLCRCQPPLDSLTNKSWNDMSYRSSVDWCTLKDIFFILKHVDTCYTFNNQALELLFCIILNILSRSVVIFSDPIMQENAGTDSSDSQDLSSLTSLLNHLKYSLSLKDSVRICQINGCLLLAQFFLRHNSSSTAFLKNQGIDVVLMLLKQLVKLLSSRCTDGFLDISVMQFGKSLMTLICNSTFQHVDIQRQLGLRGVYNLLCLFSINYWHQRASFKEQVIRIGDEAIFVCLKAIGNISLFPENTHYCVKSCVDALYKLLFEFMVSNENRLTLENSCQFSMGLLDSFLNIVMEFTEESMIRFRFTVPHLLLLFSNGQKEEQILIVDILACLTRCSQNAQAFHKFQGHRYISLQLEHLDQSKVILYNHLVLRLFEKQATRYPSSFKNLCDNGAFDSMKTLLECPDTPSSIVTRIIRISVAGLSSHSQKATVATTLDKCGIGVALLRYLSLKFSENTNNSDTQRVATWICGLVVLIYSIIEESALGICVSPLLKNTNFTYTLQQFDPELIQTLVKKIINLYLTSVNRTRSKELVSPISPASKLPDQLSYTLESTRPHKIGLSETNFALTCLSLLITLFRSQQTTVYVDYCYSIDLLPLVVEILHFLSTDCFNITMSCYLADQICIILLWFYQYLQKPQWLEVCLDKTLAKYLADSKIYFSKLTEPTCTTIRKLVSKTFHHSSKPELNDLQLRMKTLCTIIESIQDLLQSHQKPILQCDIFHDFFKSVNYPFMMTNVFSFHSQGVQELANHFKKKLRLGISVKTIVFMDPIQSKETTDAKIVKPPFPITGQIPPTAQCCLFPLLWKTSTNLLNLEGICRSTGETIFSHSVTQVICVEPGLDAACFASCKASNSQLLAKIPASHCCALQLQTFPKDATRVELPLLFESATRCQNFIHTFLKWRNAVVLGLN